MAGEFYAARFTLIDPEEITFQSGQYVIFLIGPPKRRHTLSIASSPSEVGTMDFLQSVSPMGGGSQWFLSLKSGDKAQFLGPLGKFTLQKQSPKQKVFIATGCGYAPFRSMIHDYLESGGHAQVRLWWGIRHETDLFWQEELVSLAKKYTNFLYTMTISQPTDAWNGVRGRVTEHVVGETPELTNSEFYLCGNRQMIVDMRQLLTQNGVLQEHIHTETFF